jgi:transcriptional regulator with XRE-family HTH domain
MGNRDRIARQVGSAIRRVRERRRCRQGQLAASAGITRTQLARYERGRLLPTAPALARLLVALDCSEGEFSRHFGPFGEAGAILRRGAL